MPPTGNNHKSIKRIGVLCLLVALTVFGAWQLAFLCDDAYIHFRYASNLHEGNGLVWNAAPFRPVEGGGFLWILILTAVWSVTGVEPPDSANVVLIACGVVQVLILAAAANRLRRRDGTLMSAAVGLCAVAVIISNRTFLQWLSSGLDTALFNVFLLGWVMMAFRPPEQRRGAWLSTWALLAAAAALTRPDGLPLVCATVGVVAVDVLQRRRRVASGLVALLPLLLVAAHLLWRRSYYGDWLPNTYYAKVVSAWPEAGVRYFACFAFENGAWLWGLITGAWVVLELRRGLQSMFASVLNNVPATAAVVVVVFNASYYCLMVGGDHFEYRVLSHLVPLGVLASVAMVCRMSNRTMWPIVTAAGLALAGSVGWVHLALTSDPSKFGVQAISPQVPAFARGLTRWFDKQQAWLFLRYIGLRCNHHSIVLQLHALNLQRRMQVVDPPDAFPVFATGAVGLPGWCLPGCAIIDEFGLNDWVIARTRPTFGEPMTEEVMRQAVADSDANHDGYLNASEFSAATSRATGSGALVDQGAGQSVWVHHYLLSILSEDRPGEVTLEQAVELGELVNTGRLMAHEHKPPPGYVAAFEPNVFVGSGVLTVKPRRVPMTADRIRSIEAEWRQIILAK